MTSPDRLLGPEFWGGDLSLTRELLRRLELGVDPDALRFSGGQVTFVGARFSRGLVTSHFASRCQPNPRGMNLESTTATVGAATVVAGPRPPSTYDVFCGPQSPDHLAAGELQRRRR